MKTPKHFFLLILFLLYIPSLSMGATFDGSQPILCAVVDAFECGKGQDCKKDFPEDINLPQFLRIDFEKKAITGTLKNGMIKTTSIKNMERAGEKLILQGVEGNTGWSISLEVKTGNLVLSAAGDNVGFTVLGACTAGCPSETIDAQLSDFDSEQFDLIWSALQKGKKQLVSEALSLEDSEKKTFWPVYDSFQNDLKTIAFDMYNLLISYSAKHESLSNEQAETLLEKYLELELKRAALKKTYAGKFGDILPSIKLMRYFQIENKIEASLKYDLARTTPLAN